MPKMTERQLYILDQSYLGALTSDEQVEYDKFQEDPEFIEMARLGDNYQKVSRRQKQEAFHERVQSWEGTEKKIVPKKNKSIVFLIIGLLTLGSLALWQYVIHQNKQASPEQLYLAYSKPYDNLYQPLSRSEEGEDLITKALLAYESGKFRLANDYFMRLDAGMINEDIVFYHSIAKLQLGRFEEARTGFQSIDEKSSYVVPARWYEFLIAVKTEDRQSIQGLGKMLTQQSSHKVIAKSTQEILDRIQLN